MQELQLKNQYISLKCIKGFLVACVIMLLMILGLQYYGSKADKVGISLFGDTTAKVETWTEQTFWDKFWGTGFFQTRTEYTATPSTANTTRTYSNRRLIAELDNNTSLTQTYEYSRSEKYGHSVSANVKAKATHFEAAVEYKFNYETVTTQKITCNVAAYTLIDVYQSDVQIKSQYVNVKKQKQKASWTGWKNTGSATYTDEKIVEYNGCRIEYIEE